MVMTPSEQERWLDSQASVGGKPLYYHRDGRPVQTNREAMAIFGVMHNDPDNPDYFQVASTEIGESRVSTVFLCINHAHGSGAPMIFESMVFGGPLNDEQDRYSTEAEARLGHQNLVEWVMSVQPRNRVSAFFEYIADWWVGVWHSIFP